MNLVIVSWLLALAGDSLDLKECYYLAVQRYPLTRQIETYGRIQGLKNRNLTVKYLPDLSVNAQTSYQSQVTEVPLAIPGQSIPTPHKDSYQLSLSVNQLVYDFGVIRKQKEVESVQAAYDQQGVRVELHKVRGQVDDAYFSVLLLQEKERSLLLNEEDVRVKLETVRARVSSGSLLPSNADVLEAELLRIRQNLAEAHVSRQNALATLALLIDRPLDTTVSVRLPAVDTLPGVGGKKRPEYVFFDLSRGRLQKSIDLIGRRNLPKISGFAHVTYGRPGLNVFETSFQRYYIAGVKASWNLWNWQSDARDRHVARLQQELLTAQEEAFERNLSIAAGNASSEIAKLEELIRLDEEIIALRSRITRQFSSQLDNGVVTSSEYLAELNAEHQARLFMQSHRIQLQRAKINYLTVIGE
jgi:outer membrane protein TolC